jgi:glycosyltransferase involved in cell wall biosynthesis
MKILVYPHMLSIGGSQLNAVELAGAVARRGHDVTVFGRQGPLVDVVRAWGMRFEEAPESTRRPSLAVAGALVRLVERDGYDLVHGYEWPPVLEAFYGPYLRRGTAVVATVLSMSVPSFLPRVVPLIVGTRQLQEAAGARRAPVWVVEPPVDLAANAPSGDGGAFRKAYGLDPAMPLVVIVSRLAEQLKFEGLERAVTAVGTLAERVGCQLVIVGDGPMRSRLERQAEEINRRVGRRVVVLTGELLDPRPAYAAADVVLGMGGSALRAMAYAKPLIVLGEGGFSRTLDATTADLFLWQGFYGIGGRHGDLAVQLLALLEDANLRTRLGAFSRQLVEEKFSLSAAAASLEAMYQEVLATRRTRVVASAVACSLRLGWYKACRRFNRAIGNVATEDFNTRSVLERIHSRHPWAGQGKEHRCRQLIPGM